jgi:peptidoglycan hydrolase CwlO-like protein
MENPEAKYKQSKSKNSFYYMKWALLIVGIGVLTWGVYAYVTTIKSDNSNNSGAVLAINNQLGHIDDRTTGLDNLATYQDNKLNTLSDDTQRKFEETDSQITTLQNDLTDTQSKLTDTQNSLTDANTNITNLQNSLSDTQTNLDTVHSDVSTLQNDLADVKTDLSNKAEQTDLTALSKQVSELASGLQITPSISGNTISLLIKSDVAQTIAFDIEFRPTTDMPQLTGLDTSMQGLYGTPPVVLTVGTKSVSPDFRMTFSPTAGGGDGKYHLQKIIFITQGTALTAGSQIKTITFTTTGSYEVLITPVYVTGNSTGSW